MRAIGRPLCAAAVDPARGPVPADRASDADGVRDPLANPAAVLPKDAAIVEVLKRGSKEVSAPWENPSSGARGTVTPIASAYARDGLTCHDFLASYVRRGSPESWLQGQACRAHQRDAWEVKSLRPWTRS